MMLIKSYPKISPLFHDSRDFGKEDSHDQDRSLLDTGEDYA